MTMNRLLRAWQVFALALAALCVTTVAPGAIAQDYPNRPVQIIVGYGPGGGTDVLARVLAQALSKTLGQSVIVRNVAGAGGQLGASAVLREGTEGYAILAINQPDLLMSVDLNNAPYKSGDLQVIMVDVRDPRVMLVQKGSDLKTFDDFVTRAKARPGKLAVSVAQGSAQELFAKWLIARLGIDVIIVGYKGGNDAANALLAGDVVANIGDDFARFNLRDRTRALFIASKDPSPRWPEAQALSAALGAHGVTPPSPNFLTRYGVYAVSATFKARYPEAYAKLQKAMLDARNSTEFQDYLVKNGLQDLSIGKPGEAFDATFAAEGEELRKLKP